MIPRFAVDGWIGAWLSDEFYVVAGGEHFFALCNVWLIIHEVMLS